MDSIFFWGDYIDNGPSSEAVIDYIMELKQQYSVYCIKGNHDDVYELSELYDPYGMKSNDGQLMPRYQLFFNDLHYCIELNDAYLVHSSLNFAKGNPLGDTVSMLWLSSKSMHQYTDKRIMRGHSKKMLSVITDNVKKQSMVISLDNGNLWSHKPDYGNLCCLELNSMLLEVQPNLD